MTCPRSHSQELAELESITGFSGPKAPEKVKLHEWTLLYKKIQWFGGELTWR